MDSATLRWGNTSRQVGVNFLIENGLRPGCAIKLTADNGAVAAVELPNEALLKLVANLIADPRFKVDHRKVKPDASLDAQVDAILGQLKGK